MLKLGYKASAELFHPRELLVFSVHAEAVEAMIEEGIIAPIGGGARHWRFTRISVVRVRSVLRMQRDLHVNLAGAALALDLLERIEALNDRIKASDPI